MTSPEPPSLRSRIESSPLYNPDLAPADASRRHWGTYNFAALWISMSVNILTYMLAASLIQGGMNWKQAVMTIFIGNVIVLAPMLLNSHPGAKYGVPFPVLARASFGVLGANVAAVLRALVACGWFGIQTWIGGEAINTLLATLAPTWKSFPYGTAVCFLLILADQPRRNSHGDRIHPHSAGHQRTSFVSGWAAAPCLGLSHGGRLRPHAGRSIALH